MGRVRNKVVKKASRLIIEKYYSHLMPVPDKPKEGEQEEEVKPDFQLIKKVCSEVAVIPSKRIRNQIAGYIVRLLKRIAKGPVRGISIKLQEEERERRDNYMPEVSAVDVDMNDELVIDKNVVSMLDSLGVDINNVVTVVKS